MVTKRPKKRPRLSHDQYAVFMEQGKQWWMYYKIYDYLWTALKYGTAWMPPTPHCVVNLRTDEIVWESWTDENKYKR